MKKIKTVLVLIVIILLSFQSQAQLQLGVRAGLNVNGMKNRSENYPDKFRNFPMEKNIGFHFGIASDYFFNGSWSLRTGLYYSRKGYDQIRGADFDPTTKINRVIMDYLEFPLQVTYTWRGFGASTGPYLAYGVRGEHKYEYSTFGYEINDTHSLDPRNDVIPIEDIWITTTEEWNVWDYGWVFDLSYQWNKWRANLTYNTGMADTSVKTERETEPLKSNRTMMFSVSYFFLKKK